MTNTFAWNVADDYEWKEVSSIGLMTEAPKVWVLRPVGDIRKTYLPLRDTPQLFRDFARVPPGDAHAYRDFARRYGLLGLKVFPSGTRSADELADPVPLRQSWTDELTKVWRTLARWDALKRQGHPDASHLIPRADLLRAQKASKTRARRIETSALAEEIAADMNEAIQRHELTPRVQQVRAGNTWRFSQDHAPRSLIGAIWLQSLWAITGRQDFAECRNCGATLPSGHLRAGTRPARRSHAKFCNDLCRASWHQDQKRLKKEQENAVSAK